MSRSQLLQFDMEEEFWEDSRRHATRLYNRVPHRDMYLANHGCLLSRNNILRERLRINLNYILLVLSVGLISRKLGDLGREMAIPEVNMVSLLATMMNRDHYSLGYIFQRMEYLNYMITAI